MILNAMLDSDHYRQMYKADPKNVIKEYRKSPGPDAYDLPGSMKMPKQTPYCVQKFDSLVPKLKYAPTNAAKTTLEHVAPGSYLAPDE